MLRIDNADMLRYNREARKSLKQRDHYKTKCHEKNNEIIGLTQEAARLNGLIDAVGGLGPKLDHAITTITAPTSNPTPQASFRVSVSNSETQTEEADANSTTTAVHGDIQLLVEKVKAVEEALSLRPSEEQIQHLAAEQIKQLVGDKINFDLEPSILER